MKFIHFTANYKAKDGKYNPRAGEVFLVTNKAADEFAEKNAKGVRVVEFNSLLKPLDATDNAFTNLLILRTGGIGDLLALSAMCETYVDKTVTIATQLCYKDVFQWFKSPPKIVDIAGPILKNYRFDRAATWRRYVAEGLIEAGSDKNWFEIFYDFAGLEYDTAMFRPQLRTLWRPEGERRLQKDSILICNKASCMMRSIEFDEIYNALPKDWLEKYTVYTYAENMTRPVQEIPVDIDSDLGSVPVPAVKILPKTTLNQYLLDLHDAALVISVDSAAIHFREGIEKFAIGLYSSFTAECRTKHYRWTRSFNIKSDCPLQPCFIHETDMPICPQQKKLFGLQHKPFAAPCVSNCSAQIAGFIEDFKLNPLP
jgi:hypothetical protein